MISDNYIPLKELGNGITQDFSDLWKVINSSYIRVYLESVATGVQTLQTLGADFTLVFNTIGFTVHFITAPSSLYYVVIGREVSVDQGVPYKTSVGFQGAVEENSFDKLTAICQDLRDTVSRSIVLPLGSTNTISLGSVNDRGITYWDNNVLKSDGPTIDDLATIDTSVATAVAAAASASGAASAASASAAAAAASAASAKGVINGGVPAGTANAITLPSATPALTGYGDLNNNLLIFKVTSTNTATPVSINISALGVQASIKKIIGGAKVDLAIGDLQANFIAELSRDGTDIILLNPRTYSQGADIAAAGTLNLDIATGDYVSVTGATTITAITLQQGRQVKCVFAAAPIITNGASLINFTGANITAAAGDVAEFRGEAGGVVRMVDYQRATGRALAVVSSPDLTTITQYGGF